MKRYIVKIVLASLVIFFVAIDAVAQVDLQKSFGVMLKNEEDFMFAEGGNWKITFSSKDTLGNEHNKPVQLEIEGALFSNNTKYCIDEVDSMLFRLPEAEYAPGVFEIKEELFQYIVDSDSVSTIYFRIDCLTKTKIPKVEQKVICNIFRDKLPYGFIGTVESIKADYDKGLVEMKCGMLAFEDAYDVLYTSGVTGVEGSEEVPDSIIEKKLVHKRIPTRAPYDEGEAVDTVIGFKYPFKLDEKISITNNGKIVKGSDEGPIVLGVEGEASLSAHFSAIIDKSKDIKKIRYSADVNIDGKLLFEAAVDLKPSDDERTEIDLVKIPIPIVVLPGLSVNIDFGLTWDYLLEAKLHAEAGFKISRTVGLDIDGAQRSVIWVDNKENLASNPLNFSNYKSAEICLKGELFFALHAKVGLGIAGEGLEFQVKFGTGPKFTAQLTYKAGQKDETISDDPKWLSEREEVYKGLNEGTFFTVDWGLLFDVQLSAGNGAWTFAASEWMEKVGLDNKAFFEIYRLNAAPDTEKLDNNKLFGGAYSGTLKNKHGLIFPYDAGVLFVDVSPGARADGLPDYYREREGKFNALKANDVSFNIDISDQPQLKGRQIGVYPVIYNPIFTGNLVMGKYDEFYIPYNVRMTGNDKDYENAEITAEFDIEAKDNSYITEGGFIFLEPETGRVLKPEVIFSSAHPGTNVMKTTVTRGMFPRDEFDVQAYIIDSSNNQYMYSTVWPGGFVEYYAPITREATEITAVGATLNAELHNSIYEAEDLNHVDNRFSVGFTYSPNGSTAMDYLNNVRFSGYEWNLDGKLEPNKEYNFNAIVKDNETGKTYKGLQLQFRTKPVFSGVEADASYTKVLFFAKVDKGFMGISDKSKYKFLVSSIEALIDEGEEIEIAPEDITRDSNDDDYEIIVETDNKWDREKLYYVKVVYDNGNGVRHESSVEKFAVPPPIDNIAAKPASESAALTADVEEEYAKGKSEITLQFSTTKQDFEENAESIEITDDITWKDGVPGAYQLNYTLDNLEPSTNYYYRYKLLLELDDDEVEYISPINTFKTLKLELMATTMSATVTKNRVSMTGSVTKQLKSRLDASIKSEDEKQYMLFFEVSKNKDMSASAVCYVPLSDEREYSAELRNLAWNTKYYYRFVAMTANDRQFYRGAIKNFTIAEEPADNYDVETFDAVLDDEWTTLRGKVNSTVLESIESGEYNDMYIGFEYAQSVGDLNEGNENVIREGGATVNMNTGYYSRVLNLMPDTRYYYRAFVYAAGKFSYGNIVEFKTQYYDAGLIVPDNAKRRREIEAVKSTNYKSEKIIFFENGIKNVPTEHELKMIIEQ